MLACDMHIDITIRSKQIVRTPYSVQSVSMRSVVRFQHRYIGAALPVQRVGLDAFDVADPAVAWSCALGQVDCDCAVGVGVPEVVARADFDAVRETVDEGFGDPLGAGLCGQWR